LLIPKSYFEKITEKIVRGLTYVMTGRFIEPPYYVDFIPDGEGVEHSEFVQLIRAHGKSVDRGPGIKVNYLNTEGDITGLFEIVLWGNQLKTYAFVDRKDI